DNTTNPTNGNPNFQTVYTTVSFIVDQTNPQSGITLPSNNAAFSTGNQLTTISGTAVDSNAYGSGIARVKLSIALVSNTTKYFDGSDFNNDPETYFTATGTGSWTYSSLALTNAIAATSDATFR